MCRGYAQDAQRASAGQAQGKRRTSAGQAQDKQSMRRASKVSLQLPQHKQILIPSGIFSMDLNKISNKLERDVLFKDFRKEYLIFITILFSVIQHA
jgi:hypothetical protein